MFAWSSTGYSVTSTGPIEADLAELLPRVCVFPDFRMEVEGGLAEPKDPVVDQDSSLLVDRTVHFPISLSVKPNLFARFTNKWRSEAIITFLR